MHKNRDLHTVEMTVIMKERMEGNGKMQTEAEDTYGGWIEKSQKTMFYGRAPSIME